VTGQRREEAPVSGPDIRVGIAYGFEPAAIEAFRAISPRLQLRIAEGTDQAAIDQVAVDDLDALVGRSLPTKRSRTPSLRWLQVLSAGVEHLLGEGVEWPTEIALTNARGAYATSIAQYTIAAILRVAERMDARREQQLLDRWPDGEEGLLGKPVRGRTLVIVGYGGIGREIARLAAAFGMRVLAVKANPSVRTDDGFRAPGTGDPDGSIPERIVGIDALPDVAREADYLSITLPLTADSRGAVGWQALAALPAHAWLVNTGRGPVVDETALIEILEAGGIGGAVLDVFAEEPLPPSSPFWRLPNVVITPHVSGSSSTDLSALVAENLRRFVAGEALLNPVNPQRGY
jgi:phosphoglycerate dehydrogenase-like enzyme